MLDILIRDLFFSPRVGEDCVGRDVFPLKFDKVELFGVEETHIIWLAAEWVLDQRRLRRLEQALGGVTS